jgi:PPOX class probable F420-dependent enzyme
MARRYAGVLGDVGIEGRSSLMEDMSKAEYMAFLAGGTLTGKLATVREDGRPHVVPIWFVVDGETLVFTAWHSSVKVRNIQRDPRVCLCVDTQEPPFHYVMVEGRAEFMDVSDEERVYWATRNGARYMGPERGDEFGKRNGIPGEMVFRIHIDHVVAHKNVTA